MQGENSGPERGRDFSKVSNLMIEWGMEYRSPDPQKRLSTLMKWRSNKEKYFLKYIFKNQGIELDFVHGAGGRTVEQ